jgi:hypothetical protein
VPQKPDAGLRQRGEDGVVQQPVLLGHQHPRFVGDDAEQCAKPRQREARRRELRAQLLLQPATRISKNSSRLLPTMHRKPQPLEQRNGGNPAPARGRGG